MRRRREPGVLTAYQKASAREFRARIGQIPVGHVLEVFTNLKSKDPSDKEDLPSISRMMGHKVLSIDPGAQGKIVIRVERTK